MQISEHVHLLKIPFLIPMGPGKSLERFTYIYLIVGDRVWLIDAGVRDSVNHVLAYLAKLQQEPETIAEVLLTHAHPDHMGGLCGVVDASHCRVRVHEWDAAWVDDVARQYADRPVPGFELIVEGSVSVDAYLQDGERLELDSDNTLHVIHTPGHSSGHVAYFHEQDGVLFAGDAIPLPGAMPIYDDVVATLQSVQQLGALAGVKVLLSSWDAPREGTEVMPVFAAGEAYIQRIHDTVKKNLDLGTSVEACAVSVYQHLGLPPVPLSPVLLRAIQSHYALAQSGQELV